MSRLRRGHGILLWMLALLLNSAAAQRDGKYEMSRMSSLAGWLPTRVCGDWTSRKVGGVRGVEVPLGRPAGATEWHERELWIQNESANASDIERTRANNGGR